MHTITSTTSQPASNQQLIALLQQQAKAAVAARQQGLQAAKDLLLATPPAPPAHKAASTASNGTGRHRTGANQQYNAIVGNLRPTALAQLLGFWGYTKEQALAVCTHYWANVNKATVFTGRADGATKGIKKKSCSHGCTHGNAQPQCVYKDYKVPQIMADLGANAAAVQAAVKAALAS